MAQGPVDASPPGEPCILVIFGASGDLTKRLLVPALYNLGCDGLCRSDSRWRGWRSTT